MNWAQDQEIQMARLEYISVENGLYIEKLLLLDISMLRIVIAENKW